MIELLLDYDQISGSYSDVVTLKSGQSLYEFKLVLICAFATVTLTTDNNLCLNLKQLMTGFPEIMYAILLLKEHDERGFSFAVQTKSTEQFPIKTHVTPSVETFKK